MPDRITGPARASGRAVPGSNAFCGAAMSETGWFQKQIVSLMPMF
jgi:hypothetical protein